MKSTPQNTDRQPELIPAKLRELTQWVVWKTVDKGGRPTKVPYQTSGYEAKSNDRDTWTEFNAAVAVVERFEGVGFVFSAADDLCGIDLDACRDPLSGRIAPWATYWIDKFNSYTEVSPSESGVKIFVQGKNPRPRGKNRRVDEDAITDKPPGVEIYDKVRFFTVTAQRHENVSPNVEPRQDVIDEFLATYFPLKETATANHNGNGKATGNGKAPSNIADRAAKYVGKMPEAIDGQGGHTATFEVAAVLKRGFSLSDNDAWRILCRYNDRCKPPWSEHDLRRKMDEGAKADRDAGYLLNDSSSASSVSSASEAPEDVVTNAIVKVGNGEEKPKKFPLRLNEIIARTRHQTGDWPRRMGNVLFIDDQQHGISFFDKSPQLFGWFAHKVGRVAWHGGPSSVKQPELFAEYQRTATSYLSVEPLPHEPPMPNRYYSGADIRAGDGSKLHELVDRFCPATDIDGDLILAAFLTPGWGGPAGCRPCFVITSDDGRGAGKSTVAILVARVWQGILSFSAAEDINKIKTRLLSSDALVRRVCLLDNVKSLKFSWAELEAMITASEIGGHRMYAGEATRPNTLTWFITLNGASLSTDMAQRAVVIKVKKPTRSATWLEDTQEFVDEHREKIIADIIGTLRRPAEPLEKFSRWASWEREILGRLPEPNDAQAVIAERQDAVDVETDEVATIEEYFAERLKWLGYEPATDKVFIPSNIATAWYCSATNERKNTVAVGRIMSQLCTEGRCARLSKTGRSYGRGFVWAATVDAGMAGTWTDIRERITQKSQTASGGGDIPL